MKKYVDGFVLPLRADRMDAYRLVAEKSARLWLDHGALEYVECLGDDLDHEGMVPFPALVSAQPGEKVVFAWITFTSREHRDAVIEKVMADPRLAEVADPATLPFDAVRLAYGGFSVLVASHSPSLA